MLCRVAKKKDGAVAQKWVEEINTQESPKRRDKSILWSRRCTRVPRSIWRAWFTIKQTNKQTNKQRTVEEGKAQQQVSNVAPLSDREREKDRKQNRKTSRNDKDNLLSSTWGPFSKALSSAPPQQYTNKEGKTCFLSYQCAAYSLSRVEKEVVVTKHKGEQEERKS